MKKYHYFYKITNTLNNHFYYGVHNTDNLEDGYMGSGTKLHVAYEKYGIENFTKEILKFFDTAEEAFEYEAEVVNEELVKSHECYNIQGGGRSINTIGLVVVEDSSGNRFMIPKGDERIVNEGLKIYSPTRGKVTVKRKNVQEDFYLIDKDEYANNKDLYDTNWTNKNHSDESKNKIRETMTPKNSTNDRVWVNKNGVVKYLDKKKLDEYLNDGWRLGRTGYKPRKGCMGKLLEE